MAGNDSTGDVNNMQLDDLAAWAMIIMVLFSRKFLLSLSLLLLLSVIPMAGSSQDGTSASGQRKVRVSPRPEYPELARRLSIHGAVQLWVKVSAEGVVRDVSVVGGNPILVDTCVNTVKKWRYEPAGKESLEPVRFQFD